MTSMASIEAELNEFAAAKSGPDLVPGSVPKLLAAQDELDRLGEVLADVVVGLRAVPASSTWTGPAAEAFSAHQQAVAAIVDRWTVARATVRAVLEHHQNALTIGQNNAQAALDAWRTARASAAESVRWSMPSSAEASNAGILRLSTDARLDTVKRRAVQMLRDARADVAKAGDEAARQVTAAIKELRNAQLPRLQALVDARSAQADSTRTPSAVNGWSGRTAVVRAPTKGIHDSLSRIAERTLGDARRWPEIYRLNVNQHVAPHAVLHDPNLIQPGWALRLPDNVPPHHPGATSNPSPSPVTPHNATHPGPASHEHAEPSPTHHAPEPPPDHVPRWASHTAPRVRFTSGGGVSLGEGVLLGGGAVAVLAGIAVAVGSRRSVSGRKLEGAVGPVIRQLAELSPADPSDPVSAGQLAFGSLDESTALVDIAGALGLGMVGPGAARAARAALVGVLTTDPGAQALITREAVSTALPELIQADSTGRVATADSLAAALDRLETAILTRTRQTEDPSCELTPLLFITLAPADSHRLQAVADLAVGLNIMVIVLGEWPSGVTCHVAADGVIETVTGERGPGWVDGLTGVTAFGVDDATTAVLLELLRWPTHEADQTTAAVRTSSPEPDSTVCRPGEIAQRLTPPTEIPDPDRTEQTVELKVLGRLLLIHHAESGLTDITAALTPKQRQVLIFLAVHRDGVQREALAAALWPDARRDRPYNALHTTLSQMRRVVREATNGEIVDLTMHRDGRYALDEAIAVDLWEVQQDLDEHRRIAREPDRRRILDRLLSTYRGDIAEEVPETWIEAPREAVRRELLNALADDVARLRPDDPDRAVGLLEQARRLDPLNEAIYRDIMRLQAKLGRYQAISQTLMLLRAALAEVDARPSDGTVALAEALLGRESTADDR